MRNYFIIIAGFFLCNVNAQHLEKEINASIKREDTSTIKIKRLNINSEYSDFSPYVLRDTLLFVSGRRNSTGVVYLPKSGEGTDIYLCTKTDSIHYKDLENLGTPVNTKLNEGSFTMNKSGNVLYFTSNDGPNTLKIFESHKEANGWSKPTILNFCNQNYSYCHPSLSADGKKIFYSSDQPGGYGGMDLYYSTLGPSGWNTPVNLGKKINSTKHELFPFIAGKNNLYFSSNQATGLGGLDIYCMNLSDTLRGILKHFGTPLNSRADDFGVWVDSTLEKGYFSTNRVAKNKDDIYLFYTWIPDFSDSKKPVVKNSFCYTFFEESIEESSDTSSFVHEWDFGDGQKKRSIKARHCYSQPGAYLVQLNIIQKVSGEIFRSEASYTLNVDPPKELVINCRDTIIAGKEELISSERSSLKDYDINDIYWCFGDGKYNNGTCVKHNYKKPGAYNLQLWVTAKNQKTSKVEKFRIEKKVIVTDKNIYAKK
jgi:hypothetical protein